MIIYSLAAMEIKLKNLYKNYNMQKTKIRIAAGIRFQVSDFEVGNNFRNIFIKFDKANEGKNIVLS